MIICLISDFIDDTGVATLFPGYQKSAPEPAPPSPTPLTPTPAVVVVSESEWETDYTEDEQETKADTPKLEDPLAKLDNLNLDSDDDMRYQSYARTAAKKEEKAVEEVKDTIPEPSTTITGTTVETPFGTTNGMANGNHNGITNGTTNGFHKEDVEQEEVEVAEPEAPASTFISEMIDIDDLLMKGSHFVALDSSPVFFNDEEESTPKTLSGDFTNAKPIAHLVQVSKSSLVILTGTGSLVKESGVGQTNDMFSFLSHYT